MKFVRGGEGWEAKAESFSLLFLNFFLFLKKLHKILVFIFTPKDLLLSLVRKFILRMRQCQGYECDYT